jgi:thioredoxin-like negative regulator of GroEL
VSENPIERDLAAAIEAVDRAPAAALGLGIPRCPASAALGASLETIASARPGATVVMATLGSDRDWALREDELWPRGIRVSRSSVPVLVALADGRAIATRPGAAPAHVLDEWLSRYLGPPDRPVIDRPSERERDVLERTAARRIQHAEVKGRHDAGP